MVVAATTKKIGRTQRASGVQESKDLVRQISATDVTEVDGLARIASSPDLDSSPLLPLGGGVVTTSLNVVGGAWARC